MKRVIVPIIAGEFTDVSSYGVTESNVKRVWTISDRDELFTYGSNTKTTVIDELKLKHLNGVFLEDKVHDWKFESFDGVEKFHYYSRVVKTGDTVEVLFEFK